MAEPGLPDPAAVAAALEGHPTATAADARARSARATAQALAAGPHEFTMTGSVVNRSIRNEGGFAEFEAQISRPLRLPGKARLDRQIGAAGVRYARNMAEDARHHLALQLAQHWWDWMGAAAQAHVDRQAVGNAQSLLASVTRRVGLRDAGLIEQDQAQAALGAIRAAAAASQARETVARARLMAQFPGFPLPAVAPDVGVPGEPAGGLAMLHDRILGRSHELAAAQALAQQAQASADRARRDRVADPSVGLRVFSDKGGMERGGGLVFSMPFGGGFRSAAADRAAADAGTAEAELQAVQRDIHETADADLAGAEGGIAAWQQARAALDAQVAALQKMRRGHALGEIDLSDLLTTERLVHDAFRAEAAARVEAQRALTSLRIDAHQLWIVDEEDEAPKAEGGRTPD